jgi:hypothetical protein
MCRSEWRFSGSCENCPNEATAHTWSCVSRGSLGSVGTHPTHFRVFCEKAFDREAAISEEIVSLVVPPFFFFFFFADLSFVTKTDLI